MIADRQGGDEGGQGGTDQTGFAQQQIARAPRHRGQHADTGTGGGPDTAGTLERMIVVQHAGDPDAAGRALQVEHEVGAVAGSGGPTSRTACRRRRRASGNGSRHARLTEPRTAKSLCCRAACRLCARSVTAVPVRAATPAAGAGPCRSGSPMPGRRDHRRTAAATSWSNPGPASRPARPPAHADGTATRPGRPGSAPRRSGGPCRKDQRAPCSSCRP